MTDAELSLSVARIMYPEHEWSEWRDGKVSAEIMEGRLTFSYRSKICAFDMAVWLASNATLLTQKNMPYLLRMDDAVFQLAMAIKKIGESNEVL